MPTQRCPRPRWQTVACAAVLATASSLVVSVGRAEQPAGAPSWWHPPEVDEVVPLIGQWIAQSKARSDYKRARAARHAREDGGHRAAAPEFEIAKDRWRAYLIAREATAIRLDGGARLLIVPYSRLGGQNDLWVIRQERDGTTGVARFLGVNPPSVCRGRSSGQLVRGSVRRGVLTLHERGPGGRSVSTALADLDRDDDGDGLTNLVERRLKLDSSRSDSDGDTLDDSRDLAPNATVREPRDDDDRIALAIVNATLAREQAPPGSLVVVHHQRALEWRAPGCPTITVPRADDETPRDLRDACNITLSPHETTVAGDQSALGAADAATRDWELSHFRGTCGSVRTCRVRLTSDGWTLQGERPDVFF